MDIGLLYWILWILWFLSVIGVLFWPEGNPNYVHVSRAGSVLQLVLFFLIGWQIFGFVLRAGGRG